MGYRPGAESGDLPSTMAHYTLRRVRSRLPPSQPQTALSRQFRLRKKLQEFRRRRHSNIREPKAHCNSRVASERRQTSLCICNRLSILSADHWTRSCLCPKRESPHATAPAIATATTAGCIIPSGSSPVTMAPSPNRTPSQPRTRSDFGDAHTRWTHLSFRISRPASVCGSLRQADRGNEYPIGPDRSGICWSRSNTAPLEVAFSPSDHR